MENFSVPLEAGDPQAEAVKQKQLKEITTAYEDLNTAFIAQAEEYQRVVGVLEQQFNFLTGQINELQSTRESMPDDELERLDGQIAELQQQQVFLQTQATSYVNAYYDLEQEYFEIQEQLAEEAEQIESDFDLLEDQMEYLRRVREKKIRTLQVAGIIGFSMDTKNPIFDQEKMNVIPQHTYDNLKTKMLKGTYSLEEVRDTLIKFDQQTPGREASVKNLAFLYDPDVRNYIHKQSPEMVSGYQKLVSFTEFHVAQRLAGRDPKRALAHFKSALVMSADDTDPTWLNYIKGTIFYMEGKRIPQSLIDKVTQKENAAVLERLNQGLATYGTPDYARDYYN